MALILQYIQDELELLQLPILKKDHKIIAKKILKLVEEDNELLSYIEEYPKRLQPLIPDYVRRISGISVVDWKIARMYAPRSLRIQQQKEGKFRNTHKRNYSGMTFPEGLTDTSVKNRSGSAMFARTSREGRFSCKVEATPNSKEKLSEMLGQQFTPTVTPKDSHPHAGRHNRITPYQGKHISRHVMTIEFLSSEHVHKITYTGNPYEPSAKTLRNGKKEASLEYKLQLQKTLEKSLDLNQFDLSELNKARTAVTFVYDENVTHNKKRKTHQGMHISAREYLLRYIQDNPNIDEQHKQQLTILLDNKKFILVNWAHLQDHASGGSDGLGNVVLSLVDDNSDHMFGDAIRNYLAKQLNAPVKVQVIAHLIPDTIIAHSYTYKISCVGQDFKISYIGFAAGLPPRILDVMKQHIDYVIYLEQQNEASDDIENSHDELLVKKLKFNDDDMLSSEDNLLESHEQIEQNSSMFSQTN